jgi:DNA-binding NarL/FixJ family response regulator
MYRLLLITPRELMCAGITKAIEASRKFRIQAAVRGYREALLLPPHPSPHVILLDGGYAPVPCHALSSIHDLWPCAGVLTIGRGGLSSPHMGNSEGPCEAWLPDDVSVKHLLQALIQAVPKTPDLPFKLNTPNMTVDRLTSREQNVLQLLAQGLDNKAIAATLKLSELTVKSHLKEIYGKLQVHNRVAAALLWREVQPCYVNMTGGDVCD